ncbi:L,D-transpeptidase [Acidovorax sp. Leaf78]|uniref:L,D-transpeptidase n=1 Tax=unclassified Acidovorax TaxID=2684926 RepID=UPI001F1E8B98|nr:L,D-transpeptidase [Acidovorax sp. Leaf78]
MLPKKNANKISKTIKVNLSLQIVEAMEGLKRVFVFDCVTGDKGHPTNRGSFRISRKAHPYRSKTYDVQMDYAMFFTADGKAFHQYHGSIPLSVVRSAKSSMSDWFGSHGCVRLTQANARALYDWAPEGTMVHIF